MNFDNLLTIDPGFIMFYFTLKDSGIEIDIKSKHLDVTNFDRFKAIFNEYSVDRDLDFAHINMQEVEFIDNAGTGALLEVHRHLKEGADPIKLIEVRPGVVEILEILKLTRIFNVESRQKM